MVCEFVRVNLLHGEKFPIFFGWLTLEIMTNLDDYRANSQSFYELAICGISFME